MYCTDIFGFVLICNLESFALIINIYDKCYCYTDEDECQESNGHCEGTCVNTVGSYHCQCPHGYQLNYDNHTCLDVDECWPDKFNCSHKCVNLEGSAKCSCLQGYNLQDDGKSCVGKESTSISCQVAELPSHIHFIPDMETYSTCFDWFC